MMTEEAEKLVAESRARTAEAKRQEPDVPTGGGQWSILKRIPSVGVLASTTVGGNHVLLAVWKDWNQVEQRGVLLSRGQLKAMLESLGPDEATVDDQKKAIDMCRP